MSSPPLISTKLFLNFNTDMFLRLVYQSFHRQRRSKLLAGVAVALGAAVATAMLAVAAGIGDKVNRELRTLGANIIVRPVEDTLPVETAGTRLPTATTYLSEADVPKIKSIFWRHNILGFAPFLPVTVQLQGGGNGRPVNLVGTYFAKQIRFGQEEFVTGVRSTHPWWKVQGQWPADDSSAQVLVGADLAQQLKISAGDSLTVNGHTLAAAGILSTGNEEDEQIIAPLGLAQQFAGAPGAVKSIYVTALTKPEDAFARRDPSSLSPADRDRWYCSPYANSIAFQLAEVIPHAHAEQVRQVAQSEGQILSGIEGLMLLITLAAMAAAALAVSAAMANALLERRREIGLMKALGASRASVASVFYSEAAILALSGGVAGFLLGALLARQIGRSVFDSAIDIQPALLPLVLLAAGLIVACGSALAIRRAVRFDPVLALRGDA